MSQTTATSKDRSIARENVGVELNKVAVGAIGISSAIIGCWAVACLSSAMISSGGPVSLVSHFVSAVIG